MKQRSNEEVRQFSQIEATYKKKHLNKAFIDGPADAPRVITQIRRRIVWVPDQRHKKNGGYRVEEYFDGFTVPLALLESKAAGGVDLFEELPDDVAPQGHRAPFFYQA